MGKTNGSQAFPKPQQPKSLVQVTNTQRKFSLSVRSAERVIEFLVTQENLAPIHLHFVGKAQIKKLHKELFDNASPTDCITLPYNEPHILGEIFVCPEIALEYTQEHEGDLSDEVTLYVVHGFLHLLGEEDQTDVGSAQMRKKEKDWMKKLCDQKLRVEVLT